MLCCELSAPAQALDPQKKLSQVESEVDRRKQQEEALAEQAAHTNESLKELQQKLINATDALNAKEEEEQTLEDKLDDLNTDIGNKSTQMQTEQRKLSLLTGALIELSNQPPESFLLQTGLTTDSIHRTILIRSLLPKIREQADSLAHDLATLNDLKTQSIQQNDVLMSAKRNLEEQESSFDQLIKTRQGLLQRTEQQKEAIETELVSLASQAQDLRQLLNKITPRHNKPRTEPDMSPALKWPVSGRVLHSYGEKDNDGITSDGITFTALSAAPVVAPRSGKVVFAGIFKGYGKVVILQHEGGYHSLLAGFGRIDAEMEQDVETGEPLGVMPVDSKNHPQLYFEWRHNNEPTDPAIYKP